MDLAEMDDDALENLRQEVVEEQELRRYPRRIESLIKAFQNLSGIKDGSAWRPVRGAWDAVLPGHSRVFEGALWENTSGVPLSHSPAEYPQGWTKTEDDVEPDLPDPEDYEEWGEGEIFEEGDIRAYRALVYICITGHTAHVGSGWTPDVSPALWDLWE